MNDCGLYYFRLQATNDSPVWMMSTPNCPLGNPCFSRCYTQPPTIEDATATCEPYIYITCSKHTNYICIIIIPLYN